MSENQRRVRIVDVNSFIQNNGVIKTKSFLISFVVFYELVLSSLMFIDYYFFSHTDKDILEALNQVGGDFFVLQRYCILHFIDNTLVSDINTFFSNTSIFSIQIPYFYNWISYRDFQISWFGQIMIDLSIYLTLSLFILVFIQMKHQLRYRTMGLHSIYSPIPLIIFSYLDSNYHYFKRVSGVKRDIISKEKKREILDRFFKDNDLYLKNNIDDLDIKTDNQEFLWGFYNYYRLSIIKIPPKELKSKK